MATLHSLSLEDYISPEDLHARVRTARIEDMGPDSLDLTSDALVAADAGGRALVRARCLGRLAGAALLPTILRVYDSRLTLRNARPDGEPMAAGDVAATLGGPLRSILAVERVALNFLCHLSGIATLTAQYVDAVRGTRARILDTRKTLPGLRALQKYAVACGGGSSHRMGLYDAVLVKDNHVTGKTPQQFADSIAVAIASWRERSPQPTFVEVEVDTLDQLAAVLKCDLDVVLLDNMSADQLREAVALRDGKAPSILLETSGGIDLDTARTAAQTGIDLISIGALTHSAPALDLALDVL